MITRIEAKNLTAQLNYRGAGNSPGTQPTSAISNCFPGLEMDFRNVWKRIFVGIELHEATNFVVSVDPDAPPELAPLAPVQAEDPALEKGYLLLTVNDTPITAPVTGPLLRGGPVGPLPDAANGTLALEWSNVLAAILHKFAGQTVECRFQSIASDPELKLQLTLRKFFDEVVVDGQTIRRPSIDRELAPPGAFTQSLCSPWQNDYRECGCFYWAASRPDYVNIEPSADGTSSGHNWMQKNRNADTPRTYLRDDFADERFITYFDLFRDWEKELRFVIGGKDE